jgi:CRP/FNR family transcriptional regulator, cyclic AMP receptor protein
MKQILVIEDNQKIRANIAEILQMSGYKATTATNGKQGVTIALEQKPDLIICDIMMPELDGYGVIHMLQKNTATQNIPFIFLTAKAERSEIRKGMEMGADDYITKPFNGTELLNAVESRLKKADVIKEQFKPGIGGLNELITTIGGQEALNKLTELRRVQTYNKKQFIYNEGKHPYYLYFIQRGKVKTYRTNDDGKQFIIELYNEGDFIGYTALLENSVYQETAEAMEETDIALIPKGEFENLMNGNKDVMQRMIQILAKDISVKEKKLLSLAYSSVRQRVAETLVTLYKKYKTEGQVGSTIDMSRDDLSSIVGTATETLIRTLSDFKGENLIDVKGSRITILNEKKLENLAGLH